MNEEQQAQALARWLESGGDPPVGMDPDAIEAVYALRPDLAPPPRVSIDDILGDVASGPFAHADPPGAQVVPFPVPASLPEPDAAPEPEPVPANDTLGWRRWGGGLVGVLAAAVAMFVVLDPGPSFEAGDAATTPAAADAPTLQTVSTDKMVAPKPGSVRKERSVTPSPRAGRGYAKKGEAPPPPQGVKRSVEERRAPATPAEADAVADLGEEDREDQDGTLEQAGGLGTRAIGSARKEAIANTASGFSADVIAEAEPVQEELGSEEPTPGAPKKDDPEDAVAFADETEADDAVAEELALEPAEAAEPEYQTAVPVAASGTYRREEARLADQDVAYEDASVNITGVIADAQGIAARQGPAEAAQHLAAWVAAPASSGLPAAVAAVQYAIQAGDKKLALSLANKGLRLKGGAESDRRRLEQLRDQAKAM